MEKDVLLIDGLCALCTKSGKFVSKRQVKPLEIIEQNSKRGEQILKQYNISVDSVVLIRSRRSYLRSAASIRCLLYMKWNWKLIFPFLWIIPLPIRDFLYHGIAKLRFRGT